METIALLSCIVLLAGIAWQDFRSRLISWWLLPLLLAAFAVAGLALLPLKTIAVYFAVNLLLLVGQGVLLFGWFSWRNRRWTNIVDSSIGLGDILFLVCMAAAFSTLNFIAAFVAGLLISLIVFALARFFRPQLRKEIPLAGMLSVLMLFFVGWRLVTHEVNFYSDQFLLEHLTN